MAKFGVTSGLLSIVLSMFMAGLGLGSWVSGRMVRAGKLASSALYLYASAELAIGISALVLPLELSWGRSFLAHFSLASSALYYLASGLCIALTMIPWCACMGATIPFAMLAIKKNIPVDAQRSFSFLYVANVLGAFLGAIVPLLFVEEVGFRGTLRIGAMLNALLAAAAIILAFRWGAPGQPEVEERSAAVPQSTRSRNGLLALLFTTGCTSMGAEVVWTRQFTPYLGTVVYAFASLLALYLVSTFAGSRVYRRWSHSNRQLSPLIWAALGLTAVLAVMTANPEVHLSRLLRLVIGIVPFSGLLGFVTPMLVDRWSAGDPDRAGTSYAVNVVGCIVGPLLSGFLLLPYLSERWVLLVFALPWLLLACAPSLSLSPDVVRREVLWQRMASVAMSVLALFAVLTNTGYESRFGTYQVRRDNTATIIASGEGMDRHLFVNGVGITKMTPITKMMAHLPLASLNHAPGNALAVCFGMGTSYRSLLSWNVRTTAVELVPSVPKLFWYFHSDANALLSSPLSHVVIDDGRAYLERTSEQYDVITIDPPPPVEAAGSSLLYSKEFYAVVKTRLLPAGILQQWLPRSDDEVRASVARALAESFPYVRVFVSVEGWGLHFLASSQPIPVRTPQELAERMPATALRDLIEWGPEPTPEGNFSLVLNREQPLSQVIALSPQAPALIDDRPVNEFYGLRRYIKPAIRRTWMHVDRGSSSPASLRH